MSLGPPNHMFPLNPVNNCFIRFSRVAIIILCSHQNLYVRQADPVIITMLKPVELPIIVVGLFVIKKYIAEDKIS